MRKRRKIRKRSQRLAVTKKTEVMGLRIPLFMLPVLIIFGIITVYLTIESATSGAKLAKLDGEMARIERENEILENELVRSSSLSKLGEKADELGFQKPQTVLYVSEKEAVAQLP